MEPSFLSQFSSWLLLILSAQDGLQVPEATDCATCSKLSEVHVRHSRRPTVMINPFITAVHSQSLKCSFLGFPSWYLWAAVGYG